MLFGTAGIAENSELYLSDAARSRAYRAMEEFNEDDFDRDSGIILVTGGYSKELSLPPREREARLIGEFLLECGLPEDKLLIEDESTDTRENWENSVKKYPEFFAGITAERKLGLVSSPRHLKRAILFGKAVLQMEGHWYRELPSDEAESRANEAAAMKTTLQIIETMQYLAADE